MRIIYTTGICLYSLGVRVASLWNAKARQMVAGWRRLPDAPQSPDTLTAWFHASSLGEFEQARPVLEQFKKMHPSYRICVTFFSPSGFEVRKNYPDADAVTYLPMDTPHNARRLLQRIQPTVAFFVKYDFWFNYMAELRRQQVPTYIFSAIFRPSQYFFKWYGGWFCRQLGNFSHLFVQNNESLRLLQSHGITQCSIAGDTRFDRVYDIALEAKQFPEIELFSGSDPVLMAGSSWEPDEQHLKLFIDTYQGPLKLILAPHVLSDSHLQFIENLYGKNQCIRYSQLKAAIDSDHDLDAIPKILIIDNFGMLSSLYRYAHVAYIGGGFGVGIHNTLEAITFGKPVCFGPNYHKFKEAVDIIQLGGGFSFATTEQLVPLLQKLLDNPKNYQKASDTCRNYTLENIGSTQTILNTIAPLPA